jgi:hypothetical protein
MFGEAAGYIAAISVIGMSEISDVDDLFLVAHVAIQDL